MYFWILLLFSPTAHSISLISEPRLPLRALNFAKPIEGRKLNGSVIREVEVDSELSCQFECVGEGLCLSYNVGRSKTNAERFVCQLSDSDRFSGHVNFTEDEGFKYGGLQVIFTKTTNSKMSYSKNYGLTGVLYKNGSDVLYIYLISDRKRLSSSIISRAVWEGANADRLLGTN